jgi:hypothetical protein
LSKNRKSNGPEYAAPSRNGQRPPIVARMRIRFGNGKLVLGAAAAVVAVGILVFALEATVQQPGQDVETQGNAHIDSPEADHAIYNTDPPTSGPHTTYLAPWGVRRVPVPDEVQVHNLEDGGVVVQFGDGLSYDETRSLAFVTADFEKVIFAPRPSLDRGEIVLTAWGRILRLDEVDESRIRDFIEAYEGTDHHPA